MRDLASRLLYRIQLTTDGHPPYIDAVEKAFGSDVDYAQLIKVVRNSYDQQTRVKTEGIIAIHKLPVVGNPQLGRISTSFVERQNATMRNFMRRFARYTLAFSKRFENHVHAVAIYAVFYNFVRQHASLKKLSPAMAAGVAQRLWEPEDVMNMIDAYSLQKRARAAVVVPSIPVFVRPIDPAVASHFVHHNNKQHYTKVHTAGCKNANAGAGRGGKSGLVEWFGCDSAARMENRGQIFGYDADKNRLAPIFEQLKRAGARNVQVRSPAPGALDDLIGRMDRELVDAPCTGTGIWRRRPDAKWRLTPEALDRRIAEQDAVLAQAARFVRPGGVLAYATCSLLPAENGDRIAAFLGANPSFQPLPMAAAWRSALPHVEPPSAALYETSMLLTPRRTGTDGFFFALLQRTA